MDKESVEADSNEYFIVALELQRRDNALQKQPNKDVGKQDVM